MRRRHFIASRAVIPPPPPLATVTISSVSVEIGGVPVEIS